MNTITFHIIYTPGTVKYLRLFTLSLLKWLPCSFRLVPNGCPSEEMRLLEQFCATHPRLEFMALPWEKMKRHGVVLSYLRQQETSEYFGFMDSDIWASGDFLSELTPLLADHAAVFSGVPFWRRDEQGMWNWRKGNKYVLGENVKTENGIILGSTYLAIYHNPTLTKFRQTTGIDFTTYSWYDLSPQTQQQIAQAGLQAKGYDTAKLLNILLYTQGAKFAYHEPVSLHHLGGFSCFGPKRNPRKFWQRKIKEYVMEPVKFLRESIFESAYRKQCRANDHIRQACTQYFSELLRDIFAQRAVKDMIDLKHGQIQEHVRLLREQILTLYQEFRGAFADQENKGQNGTSS